MTTKEEEREAIWQEIQDLLDRMAELARKYLEYSRQEKEEEQDGS